MESDFFPVELDERLGFTGTQINYYFVCKRKLWLFSHNVELENQSDLVLLGRLLHERSYERKLKEIEIQRIKVDFIEKMNEIHEIKRSRKIEKAHLYQLLYYLYFMKYYAKKEMKGVLNYPLLKKRVVVELTPKKESDLVSILKDVEEITKRAQPPAAEWKKYCKSCAYQDLCWA